jgi:uncharacterized protein
MESVISRKESISTQISQNRILMIDAMRGFALFGILLLHMSDFFLISGEIINTQFHYPRLDPIVDRLLEIFFRSKASTLFSIFLGYGFWIQFSNFKKKGYDFGPRYLWRLVILMGFGMLHAAFYSGDILVLYALTGGIVVITRHWKDKYIFTLALILLVNPYELYQLVKMGFLGGNRYFFEGFEESVSLGNQIKNNGSLWEVFGYNLRYNIVNNLIGNLENGRVFKFASVFLLGVLACKRDILKIDVISFWIKALFLSILFYIALYFPEYFRNSFISTPDMGHSLNIIVSGIQSVFFTTAIMSVFASVWISLKEKTWLKVLVPYGKMSLTNYVSQGVFGIFLFYGFGLNLFPYIGETWCVILALVFFIIQITFSSFYLKHHKSGPLETLWRKITWIDKNRS